MTIQEEDYLNQLQNLDLESEEIKALSVDSSNIKNFNDDLKDIYLNAQVDIDKDIANSRKDIILAYSLIEDLKDNIKLFIEEKDKLGEEKEDESDELKEKRNMYDTMISDTLKSIDSVFRHIQELHNDMTVLMSAKDRAERKFKKYLDKHVLNDEVES